MDILTHQGVFVNLKKGQLNFKFQVHLIGSLGSLNRAETLYLMNLIQYGFRNRSIANGGFGVDFHRNRLSSKVFFS